MVNTVETKNINSEAGLRAAIVEMEIAREAEVILLKQQFQLAYESVKPINLIKSTFKEVSSSEDLKNDLLSTSVSLAAGYLSKVLFEGVTHSPLRKLFGTVLMFGITNVVAKNPEAVKAVGKGVFQIITAKRSSATDRTVNNPNV